VSILLIIPCTIEDPTNFVKFITGKYRITEELKRTYLDLHAGEEDWVNWGEIWQSSRPMHAGPTIIYLLYSTLM
jgi:hypothetical protein